MRMRTTIEIPDSLYHRAKLVAAQRHTTLRRLFTEALESALIEERSTQNRMTTPPIRLGHGVKLPSLSNREIGELMDAEDRAKVEE